MEATPLSNSTQCNSGLLPSTTPVISKKNPNQTLPQTVLHLKTGLYGVALLRACVEKGGTTGVLDLEEMETRHDPRWPSYAGRG